MPSEQFPIHQVSRADAFRDETMGTKGKFWWRDPEGEHWLFKFGRAGTGEHWAEKAAAEVGALLELPVARVELAVCDEQPGTIALGFAEHATLVHGNELLQAVDSTYPVHEIRGVRAHTVQNVLSALDAVGPPAPDVTLPSAADWFVGYLLLDAVTLNTDRHHENWGVLERTDGQRELAPSYDHASSFGRELTDDERRQRLSTRDARFTVERYVRRARSGLFLDPTSSKPLHPADAFARAVALRPAAGAIWLARLHEVREDAWRNVFDRIPDSMISPTARAFATRLIEATVRTLSEPADGP